MQETQDSLLFCQTPLALRPELPNLFLFSTLARLFPLQSLPRQPGTLFIWQCWGAISVFLSYFREPPITLSFLLIATCFQVPSYHTPASFIHLFLCTSSKRNNEPGAQTLRPHRTSPLSPQSFQPHRSSLSISDVQHVPTTLSPARETVPGDREELLQHLSCRWRLLGFPPGTAVMLHHRLPAPQWPSELPEALYSANHQQGSPVVWNTLLRVMQGELGGGSLSHSSPAKRSVG